MKYFKITQVWVQQDQGGCQVPSTLNHADVCCCCLNHQVMTSNGLSACLPCCFERLTSGAISSEAMSRTLLRTHSSSDEGVTWDIGLSGSVGSLGVQACLRPHLHLHSLAMQWPVASGNVIGCQQGVLRTMHTSTCNEIVFKQCYMSQVPR